MAPLKSLFFSFLLLSFLFASAASEPCGNHWFDEGKTFASCNDLPSLNCSLHWNYHSSSQTIEIAFRRSSADQKSKWISWAINPDSKGMVGSQALVAFPRDDGTMAAYTSSITSYATQLEQGNLSFPVDGVSSIVKDNEMIIFATLTLPANTTTVNHLWQEGPLVGNVPGMHRLSGPNVGSMGTLDFLSGKILVNKPSSSRNHGKIVHGVLCAFGWGFLIPVGALIARHGRQFLGPGPAWFHAHRFCQCTAYLMGLAGGIIGVSLWVGILGVGIGAGSHQYIGITVLCLGAIQGIVGYYRPHKEDKKRVYFNIFHYSVGYGTIGLSIANVFLGFHMVHFGIKTWPQLTYIVAISFLGTIALVLEGVAYWKSINPSKTSLQHQIVA
ncbi:cytochrome b561 and DOMON domain-containing protein At5g47530-like [Durio zibethinus]|uniref:Cytochrome b561 and DOMON domain-containing protein n=1 Tax=Durio zibethinus TaxID=66656 RepID=A0A6P5WQI8_DURZI|nr:cytochrome b561 and DOMON domain-containing protein At5g47530-like [Durio zibethinus]